MPRGPSLEQGEEASESAINGAFEPELLGGDTAEPQFVPCNDQRLIGGVQLPRNADLYTRMTPNAAWGTPTMIETLVSASQELSWLLPDAEPVVVGDISVRGGGYLAGHKSHRGGIDADVGLYWEGGKQHPGGFVSLPASKLDKEATWILLRSLLATGNVDRILLDQGIINVLKRHVVETGELDPAEAESIFPSPSAPRKWEMTGVVQHVANHRNHMHVRVRCEAN
jgi:murein endopeptidase